MFHKSIKGKLFASFLILSIIINSFLLLTYFIYMNSENKSVMIQFDRQLRDSFDMYIRYQVETAYTMVDKLAKMADAGELSRNDAKRIAVSLLRDVRYGLRESDVTDGYFWADTLDGTNVVLYGRKDVEGTNRNNLKDVKGNYIIQDIRANALKGGDFTDYWFPKLGQSEALPKRGYSLYHKGFDFVIGTGAYTDDIDFILGNIKEERKTAFKRGLISMIAVILAGIIIFQIAGFVISISISKSIIKTSSFIKEIADGNGDLTIALPVNSSDEIGALSSNFNNMVDNLRSRIRNIKLSVSTIYGKADGMSSAMSRVDSSVRSIASATEEISNSIINQSAVVTEVTSTIEEIARTIESQDKRIDTQAISVNQSSSAIEEMIASIKSIALNLKNSSEQFKNLEAAVSDGSSNLNSLREMIHNILHQSSGVIEANDIIKNISEKTNLLAMNAAIEAAHAGDAGKGFAVVAGEIRKLAENSSSQTRSISNGISALKETIDSAVIISEQTDAAFTKIVETMEVVHRLETEISNAVSEQSSGSTQILSALNNISQITSEVHKGSEEMLIGSSAIVHEMAGLIDVTNKIQAAMHDIVSLSSAAMKDMDITVKYVVENTNSVSEVESEVSIFIV